MKPTLRTFVAAVLLASAMGTGLARPSSEPTPKISKNIVKAVRAAEVAVARSPRDAAIRARLGRAYLAAGRLASAERAFADALALDPDDGQAALGRALTQIALGRQDEARLGLAAAGSRLGAADLGLALSLAGEHAKAIAVLEGAVRVPSASATVRQNLAFAYAMSGRWRDAQEMAGRDLTGRALERRILEWAQLSQPRGSADQVAAMIGFRPAFDPGIPERLALALPAAPPAPRAEASVAAAVPLALPLPLPVAQAQVQTLAAVSGPRFVVQIGAYYSEARLKRAWAHSFAQRAALSDRLPVSSRVHGPGRRTLHRLSVSGFASVSEAQALCREMRATGMACYVRSWRRDEPLTVGSA